MARRRKKRVLSNRGDRTGKPQAFLGTAALIAGGLKLAGGIGGGIWGAKKGKEAKDEYALMQEENANQMRQNSLQTSQMRDKLYSDALLEGYNPQGDAQMYAKNGAAVYKFEEGGEIPKYVAAPNSGLTTIADTNPLAKKPTTPQKQKQVERLIYETTRTPGGRYKALEAANANDYNRTALTSKWGDKSLQEYAIEAAAMTGVDPSEFSAAMIQEGWNPERFANTGEFTQYEEDGKTPKKGHEPGDPLSSYYAIGLDTPGNYLKEIKAKTGYKASDFPGEIVSMENELGQKVQPIVTNDYQKMINTAAALYKYRSEIVDNVAKDLDLELSPDQRKFFNYMAYNTQHESPYIKNPKTGKGGKEDDSLRRLMSNEQVMNAIESGENPFEEGKRGYGVFKNASKAYERMKQLEGSYESIEEDNNYKMGGLSREKDYGSSKKPYPKVKGKDFAGGNRSYPIPTKADAVDALRLAGLHGRSDVKAKVYAKYPGLKKKAEKGALVPYPYQDQPGTSVNPTLFTSLKNFYQNGGVVDTEEVPGGKVHQVTGKAQVVEGDNPMLIDDIELGTNPGEPDIVADHNEVIVDAVDKQTGEPYKQIFSDSITVPGDKLSFAKKAKKYLKQVPEDESSPQANRLYEKMDTLFAVQQLMNGDSHGESPEEAVAGGMDPNAAMAMGQEGQPAFQIGGEYPSPEYHASIGNMWMNTPYPKKNEFQIGGAIAEGLLGGLSTGLKTFGSGYGAGYSLTEDYYGNKNPLAGAAAITSGLSPMANDMGDTMNEWGQLKQKKEQNAMFQNTKVDNVKNAVNPGMAQSTPPVNYQPPGEGMEYLTEDELLTFSKGGRLKNTLADLQAYAGFGLRPKMCNGGKAKIGR